MIYVGEKYHRLTVLEIFRENKKTKAKCKCDCGNIKYIYI